MDNDKEKPKPKARAKAADKTRPKAAPKPAGRGRAKAVPSEKPAAAAKPQRKPRAAAPRARKARVAKTHAQAPPVPLSEEEQIERAKFGTIPPKRLFEEERFLFPESYGRNQVRLLVRDPQWLFAHFDVDPRTLRGLVEEVGERTLALSRVALRVSDPGNGGASLTLLPPGARSWYIPVDDARRSYQAELGLLLPSGVFRHLATSNVVQTPRRGPAYERARRQGSWRGAGAAPDGATPDGDPLSPGSDPERGPSRAPLGPWVPSEPVVDSTAPTPGGASDVFRR
jgi:hypothetical protein